MYVWYSYWCEIKKHIFISSHTNIKLILNILISNATYSYQTIALFLYYEAVSSIINHEKITNDNKSNIHNS